MADLHQTAQSAAKKSARNKASSLPPQKPMQTPKRRRAVWLSLLGVIILSLFLNTGAIDWGLSGDVSWSPDTIEGRITVIYLPYLFDKWTHKYPRGQYLVSSLFYLPKLRQWEKQPVTVQMPDGKFARAALDQKRLTQLAAITRRITVFMSAGILLAVFLTARKLLDDDWAAVAACLCLALSCHFVFYSQTGCVDIPAFFWFAWATCFGLYAVKSDNLLLYLLAAFCAAWSVCTKEGIATFNVGLAVALAFLLIEHKMRQGQPLKTASLSLFRWKIWAAVALAILVFVTLQGMWAGLDEWHARSQSWNNVIETQFRHKGRSLLDLLKLTYGGLWTSWGTPFLFLLDMALVYWLIRYRRQLSLILFPFLAFFFLTVLSIEFNLPRFMMPAFAGIAILMGKTLADWYRFKRIPLVVRVLLPLLVLVPSFICCVCYDLEMKNDTRVRAEDWMRTHARSGSTVGLSMLKQYAPRVWLDGFQIIPEYDSKGIRTPQGLVQFRPDYIIGSNQWPCTSANDEPFFNEMFKGQTQYAEQARFDKLYWRADKRVGKYCLRYFQLYGEISPRMLVYRKQEPSPSSDSHVQK